MSKATIEPVAEELEIERLKDRIRELSSSAAGKIEEKLADQLRMFGTKKDNGSYVMGVGGMDVVINGNIADEFEDLDHAPCIVTTIGVDSDDVTPWFKMQAQFGMTGLVWGDKYAARAMGVEALLKISRLIEEKHGTRTRDKKRIRELERAKWLKIAQDNNDVFIGWSQYDTNDGGTGCDFMHAVDCLFCCYDDRRDEAYEGVTLEALRDSILASIDRTSAFFLQIEYPTLAAMTNACHLACQDPERWARWQHISRLAHKRITEAISPSEVEKLMSKDPDEVLTPGPMRRLVGDTPRHTPFVKRVKGLGDSYPKRYKTPDGLEWEERSKLIDAKTRSYQRKVDKLGHPRFEIVIGPGVAREYYDAQIREIVHRYKEYYGTPNQARFYNGTCETGIPAAGACVVDHFDKNDTPYAVGDLLNLGNRQDDPCDGFFYRLNTPRGEEVVRFAYIDDHSVPECRYENEFASEVRRLRGRIRPGSISAVSPRTGMTYLQKEYHARLSIETIKKLWDAWG